MDPRKIVYKETAVIAVGQLICIGVMYGVFFLLGLFDLKVLIGGLIGFAVSVGNFFFMAVGTSLAADKAEAQDVNGGKRVLNTSFFLRYLVVFVVLFACAKAEVCNLIAMLLPLVFVRPIMTVGEFFRKKGDA